MRPGRRRRPQPRAADSFERLNKLMTNTGDFLRTWAALTNRSRTYLTGFRYNNALADELTAKLVFAQEGAEVHNHLSAFVASEIRSTGRGVLSIC